MNCEEFLIEYVLDDCREEARGKFYSLLAQEYNKGVGSFLSNSKDKCLICKKDLHKIEDVTISYCGTCIKCAKEIQSIMNRIDRK